MKHAIFSPSGSPYWYNNGAGCTARVMLPPVEETSSPAAERGTYLHDLAEQILIGDFTTAPIEDVEEVLAYTAYVEERQILPNTKVIIEAKVPLDMITGEIGADGHVDALVIGEDHIEVIDLKTGAVPVRASSSQLQLYGAAAVLLTGDGFSGDVVCTVHQGGEAKSITYTLEEMMQFIQDVNNYVHDTIANGMVYRPSEKNCQWCPHLDSCKAVVDYVHEVAATDFAVVEDTEALAKHMAMVPVMLKWAKAVEEKALEIAQHGVEIPGYKVVRANTRRKWGPQAEEELVALLGDAAYSTPSLIGLTAAKGLTDAETVDALTITPEGKPVLVPESDKREAISDAANDFND